VRMISFNLAAGQTREADIHRDRHQVFLIEALCPEELDIIDPDDLGAFEVNDLLIHEPFAHVDFIGMEREQRDFSKIIFNLIPLSVISSTCSTEMWL
jgi:hypothetical protein